MSEWLGVQGLQCCGESREAAVCGVLGDWALHCAWWTRWGPPAVQALCITARPAMLFQLEKDWQDLTEI